MYRYLLILKLSLSSFELLNFLDFYNCNFMKKELTTRTSHSDPPALKNNTRRTEIRIGSIERIQYRYTTCEPISVEFKFTGKSLS